MDCCVQTIRCKITPLGVDPIVKEIRNFQKSPDLPISILPVAFDEDPLEGVRTAPRELP